MNIYTNSSSFYNNNTKFHFEDELDFRKFHAPTVSIFLLIFALLIQKASSETFICAFCLKTICFLLSLTLLPIIAIIIVFFGIIRQTVTIILKIKHSKKFAGLMNGPDTVWAIEDISKSIITSALIFKLKESPEKMSQTVRKLISNKFVDGPIVKLSCTRHKAFGYNYLLNNQIKPDECIKTIHTDTQMDENFMQQFVSEHSNEPMPKNNTALWEAILFDKPIIWTNKNAFLIIFRAHHSLGDGFSLVRFFLQHLADEPCLENPKWLTKNWSTTLWTACATFWALLLCPAVVTMQALQRSADCNILHGPALTGRKIAAFLVEKPCKNYMAKVKRIKNQFPGVRFSDVVATAISASFQKFYLKNNQKNVDFVTAIIPAIVVNVADFPTNEMSNLFSVGMLNLPINASCATFTSRIEAVRFETNLLRNSPDYIVNCWLLNVISAVLPEPILRPLLHSVHCTMVISNVPGMGKVNVFGGCELKDVVFWVPHRGLTGVGMSVLTYDGRFQLGLIVDEALIKEIGKVRAILEDVFEYINKFHASLDSWHS